MFQIATNWGLLALSSHAESGDIGITLRGYSTDEPVALPAEFVSMPPLSVDKIASIFCPTRRDLFLQVKTNKKGQMTWGRIAGTLIEKYCAGILDEYEGLFKLGAQSYATLKSEIEGYTKRFLSTYSRNLASLEKHSSGLDEYEHFVLLLQYTARYELAMLGADWTLRSLSSGPSVVNIDRTNVKLHPNTKILGISSPSTPDFILPDLKTVGDVKSGKEFSETYRLTCAGYALAYESAYGMGNEIDFGVIYFFENHHRNFTSARIYAFVIDDPLRREFLDRRNEAYIIVGRDIADPPSLVDRDRYCIYCKFCDECDKARP